MLKLIDGTPSTYTERKGVWRREVGYEKGAYKFEASISNRELQNLYLGMIDKVEVDVQSFFDNRFGIALPYDALPEKVQILSNEYAMELGLHVVERGTECRLEIINVETDQSVVIEGRLVKNTDQKFAFFTHRYFKLVIDLTKSGNNVSGQFLLHKFESGKFTMQEMTTLLRVMHLLSSGQRSVIEFHCDECLLTFDIEPAAKEMQDELGVALDKLLEFVVDFKWLLLQLDIDVATLLSFQELCEHYHRLVTLLSQIRQNQPLTFRFNLGTDVPNEVVMEKEYYCYLPTLIPILGKQYWALLCYHGPVQTYDNGVVYSSSMSGSIACFREHRTTKDTAVFADRTKRRIDASAKQGVATVTYQILPKDALPIFEKKIRLGIYIEH